MELFSFLVKELVTVLIVVIPIVIQNSNERKRDKNIYCESIKCLLRNDMLAIFDSCKTEKKITKYQLQSFTYMYKQYKSMKGNSFIDEINDQIHKFELVD